MLPQIKGNLLEELFALSSLLDSLDKVGELYRFLEFSPGLECWMDEENYAYANFTASFSQGPYQVSVNTDDQEIFCRHGITLLASPISDGVANCLLKFVEEAGR